MNIRNKDEKDMKDAMFMTEVAMETLTMWIVEMP